MINIICLNNLSKFQKVDSINLLVEKEFRSPIKDIKLCSELAPSKELEKFAERGVSGETLEELNDLMKMKYETDAAKYVIEYIKMMDARGSVVNLIRYNDFEDDFSWRNCIRGILEEFDCLAEVR